MKSTFLLILFLFICTPTFSKESPYYIGAEVGYGLVSYDANFSSFKGISHCGFYESGTGNNLKGRIFAEYRALEFLNVGFHFGFQQKNGILNKPDTALVRDLKSGNPVLIQTNSQLDLKINIIDLGMDFNFLLQEDFFNGPLFLNISPSLHLLNSGNFTQTELIENPSGAAFKIDDRIVYERIKAKGDFTTLSSYILNLSAALYNNSKIAHNLYLTQKIGVSNDMSSLLIDADISSFSIFASLGIKLAFDEPKILVPPIPPQKPIQPQPIEPQPTVSISLNSQFDYENSYIEKGEKLIATQPLVLAVFFDKNNSEIPSKYSTNTKNNDNPIEKHYRILNDLANILKEDPNAKISLFGSTSGKDENNSLDLAKSRAQNVRNQLISMGIQENRISTTHSVNPRIITNQETEAGLVENRRVEIGLINANSVEFIKRTEFEKLYGKVKFETESVNAEHSLKLKSNVLDKEIDVSQDSFTIDYTADVLGKKQEFIHSSLSYDDIRDNDSLNVDLIKVQQRYVDLKTDEFEAILVFDFADSKLKNETKNLLLQLVDLLPSGKTLQIIGTSDNIGLEEFNKKLADERAQNSIDFINMNTSKTFTFEKVTNTFKFDESTPQGRYLNRNIIVRIK